MILLVLAGFEGVTHLISSDLPHIGCPFYQQLKIHARSHKLKIQEAWSCHSCFENFKLEGT